MKIGTFVCWLFGHKFIARNRNEKFENGIKHIYFTYIKTYCCVRCGIKEKA